MLNADPTELENREKEERVTRPRPTGPTTHGLLPWDAIVAENPGQFLAAACDLALLLDGKGVITQVLGAEPDPPDEVRASWIGKRLVDTVTSESKPEAEALLRDTADKGASTRRQLNHPGPDGTDFQLAYTALRLRDGKGTVVLGHGLTKLSALQARLVEMQQEMERGYRRLRHTETRYRLIFQHSSEAVLVVDAGTRAVVDANAAAARLFGDSHEHLTVKTFPFGLQEVSIGPTNDAMASARILGRIAEVPVNLTDGRQATSRISCFRQEAATLFFIRFLEPHSEALVESERKRGLILELLDRLPDAFVVTDSKGLILRANQAFLDLAQVSSDHQLVGKPLGEWLGRPGADLSIMLATLKQHGAVRLLHTLLRGELGSLAEVEVSATSSPDHEPQCHGFAIREVEGRLLRSPQGAADLTKAVEQLTDLVGRVQLRDLLRDTIDLVERHFVRAALEMTGDNRTAAAELLGLSRQSLYVKLRRFSEPLGTTPSTQSGESPD